MTKNDLLKNIVETGYNVGYAAKKHFATVDIASKAPGTISVVSTAVGAYGLICDYSTKKVLSATFLILGIVGLRISMWDHKKEDYSQAGVKLTDQFNRLKKLYYNVKASDEAGIESFEQELKDIESEFNQTGKSIQMMFSDWYAHYKFFWQQQIGWLEEQKTFTFWGDKIPLSLSIVLGIVVLGGIVSAIVAVVW